MLALQSLVPGSFEVRGKVAVGPQAVSSLGTLSVLE